MSLSIKRRNGVGAIDAVAAGENGGGSAQSGAAIVPFGPRSGGLLRGARANMSSYLSAMSGMVPAEILACATVSGKGASDPATDLFHQLEAGKHLVFMPNDQYSRAQKVVCVAAQLTEEAPDVGRVRLISWSSANGWLELYPEDGSPIARDDEGRIIPYDPEQDPPERSRKGFNDKTLLDELYGKNAKEIPVLDPLSTLRAISTFRADPKDRVKDGEGGFKKDRFIFLVNGMGPALRISASASGDGALLQALKEMKPKLDTEEQDVHLLFNDSQGEVPEKVRRVGSTFTIPTPTRRLLEAQAFERIVQRLKTSSVPKAQKELAPERIDAWRKVVSEELKVDKLAWAESLGVTPERMERFLPEGKSLKHLADQLVGFNIDQANELVGEAVSRAMASPEKRIDMEVISDARFEMLAQDFNIRQVKVSRLPEPQGLDAMLSELQLVRDAFELGAQREKPVQPHKLMIVVGPGGTGKSLTAKHIAKILNVPLYTIDFATLFNKYVGESEGNVARLFELLESLSPCALWIDEIEKALAGMSEGSATTDGGVSKRIHGQLLTWIQENQSNVFMIGTSNNPSELSGPLVNRAPLKFATGYHDRQALVAIWKANLDAYTVAHSVSDAELEKLADMKPSIVGREVEQLVNTARTKALQKKGDDGQLLPEMIAFRDLEALLEDYRTDFELDPEKARFTMSVCGAYKSASGRPLYTPRLDDEGGGEREAPARSNGVPQRRRLERDGV